MSTDSLSSSLEIEVLFGAEKQPLTYLQAVWLDTNLTANQIPSAKIVLSAPGGTTADLKALTDDAERCEPGTAVVIRIKSVSPKQVMFSGIVQQQSYGVQAGRSELTLKLRHPLHRLTATHRNQLFEKMSDKQILQQLLQGHQILQGERMDGLSVVHPQMVQFDCSDWQFIRARLNANGVWLFPSADGGVTVTEPKVSSGVAQHTLYQSQSIEQSDGKEPLIEEACWQFYGMEQPGKLAVASWDIPRQAISQCIQGKFSSLGEGGLDPRRFSMPDPKQWLLTSSLSLMADEMKALADSRYLALQAESVQARFTLMGDTAYQLGETVALHGFGKHFDGKGIISSVQHKISRGNWRTIVTLGQDALCNVDDELLPSITGLHIGIVEDHEDDPNSLSRLRVKIPAVGDKPLWARFATPYASKDSGLCLYPEPGDEVVLGFFALDPRYPVILGSMHNPKNKAPFAPSKANSKKGLVFLKEGNAQQLLFDTEEGSLSLQYDKECLRLKTGVELSASRDLVLKGENMTVSAKKDIKLNSENKLKASAKVMSIVGNDSVEIKGEAIDLG